KFQPRDAYEQAWLAEWSTPLNKDEPQAPATKSEGGSSQQFFSSPRGFRERYIEENDGRQSYVYYQPLYAKESCVRCHKHLDAGGRRPNLQANDLMAMIRVTTDNTPTADEKAKNQAY